MSLLLIAGAAAGSILALTAYRRRATADPAGTQASMSNLRQATSVLLAVSNAAWAVMDALQMLFRPQRPGLGSGQQQGSSMRIGRPADEAD